MASKIGSFVRSGLKLVLKPANPFRALDHSIKDLEDNTSKLYSVGQKAFEQERPDPGLERLRDIEDARERFRVAMEHYGVREEDLPTMEKNARTKFQIFYLMTVLAVGYAIIAPHVGLLGDSGMFALDAALPWMICAPLVALTVRASFRLHQMRNRALLPFSDWLRDPAAWLGAGRTTVLRAVMFLAIFGAAAGAIGPTSAHAQEGPESVIGSTTATDLGSIVNWATTMMHEHDLSLEWLRRMFPGAAFAWGGPDTETDILAPLFTAFNTILLAIGSGVLTWQIVAGTVSSAYSGKLLGDRYHQWWSPLRIMMGIGLLGPVKGYCMAQILVIQLIFLGYSAANGMWSLYVNTMLDPNSSAVAVIPRLDAGTNLAAQVLQAETCAHVLTYQNQVLGDEEGGFWDRVRLSWFEDEREVVQFPPAEGIEIDGARVWDYGRVCGSFKVGETSPDMEFPTVNAGGATFEETIAAYAAFDKARSDHFTQFIEALREAELANAAATTVMKEVDQVPQETLLAKADVIKAAASKYNDDVTEAAKTLVTALDAERREQFAKTAMELGWASAGAMNFTLARMSAAAVERASGAYPEVESVNVTRLTGDNADELGKALTELRTYIADTSASDYLENANTQVREDLTSWNPMAILFKPATDQIARSLVDLFALDEVHPISSMMGLGNLTLVTSEAAIVTWATMNGSAFAAEKALENVLTNAPAALASFAKGVLMAMAPMTQMFIGAMLLFGALHAYVIPLVPFILWYFAVLACATYAAEVVIAAPLAALLHVKLDGQELIEHPQRAIYVIVFNAALRPTLLLFGLILANILFAVMAGYLNKMFGTAMLASQGNNIIGIVGMITMLGILLYLHYQLATRSYSLVHQIPAMVSHLLGAQDGARNEEGDTNVVVGAITNMSRTGSSTIASGAFTPKPKMPGDKDGGGQDGGGNGQPSPSKVDQKSDKDKG